MRRFSILMIFAVMGLAPVACKKKSSKKSGGDAPVEEPQRKEQPSTPSSQNQSNQTSFNSLVWDLLDGRTLVMNTGVPEGQAKIHSTPFLSKVVFFKNGELVTSSEFNPQAPGDVSCLLAFSKALTLSGDTTIPQGTRLQLSSPSVGVSGIIGDKYLQGKLDLSSSVQLTQMICRKPEKDASGNDSTLTGGDIQTAMGNYIQIQ